MEKKSTGRSLQVPGKGSVTELKKNQETPGKQSFPRSSRRRDPPVISGSKYEPNRRSAPQKSKSNDKRPRGKGQHFNGGKEDTKVALTEEIAEYGSVLQAGSKKQNLNHLLNFHYAPREGASSLHRNWRSGPGSWGGRRSIATQKHKYNKEQFLQANCQFVVKSNGDYTPYMADPDLLVEWICIEQIFLRSVEKLSCPICLYSPVCAKMTRCGHVYCWPCILHYLALSDKTSRNCPICFESVERQDLKSVIPVTYNQFSVGQEMTLRLMKRERGSLLAVPVDLGNIQYSNSPLSITDTHVGIAYSKLLLATPNEVMQIIQQERNELKIQLAEELNSPEICFIEQALELLKERENLLPGTLKMPSHSMASDVEQLPVTSQQHSGDKPAIIYKSSWGDDCSASEAVLQVGNSDGFDREYDCNSNEHQHYESVGNEGLSCDEQSVKHYYFYQAADGQHIYLHALNIRMLEHQFGCLENCPLTLTGRIIEKESGSMTEDLRHRLRYLQHLPVTCQFEVAEIQLKPPIITRDTLELFQDKLEDRRHHRQRRAQDERRREKRINDEEKRRWGRGPSPYIHLQSRKHFPQCGPDSDVAAGYSPSPAESSVASSPTHDTDLSLENLNIGGLPPPPSTLQESPDSTSGPSFAQMLREGKSRCPLVHHAEMHSTRMHQMHPNSENEPEPEGYIHPPAFKQSFSDAIALAMEKSAAASKETVPGTGNSGKKKKQKQKLLFSTGMAYSGK